MSPTKRFIEESDAVWNTFKAVFDPRPEGQTFDSVREAVRRELNALSILGIEYATPALDGLMRGEYDETIRNAVSMSVTEIADLIMELEVVR